MFSNCFPPCTVHKDRQFAVPQGNSAVAECVALNSRGRHATGGGQVRRGAVGADEEPAASEERGGHRDGRAPRQVDRVVEPVAQRTGQDPVLSAADDQRSHSPALGQATSDEAIALDRPQARWKSSAGAQAEERLPGPAGVAGAAGVRA